MENCKRIVAMALVMTLMAGCVSNSARSSGVPPSFAEGLAAIDRNDFASASFHFAEFAKEGDPGSMNNLGVSLLMVSRKDEAIYWFKKASRYGDLNAKSTLAKMGETVPPSDLVGQHPSQLQREASQKVVAAVLIGALVGVTMYYAGKGGGTYSSSIKSSSSYFPPTTTYSSPPMGQTNYFPPTTTYSSPPMGQTNGGGYQTGDTVTTGGSSICPDGTYVAGNKCTIAPDGSYVGGSTATIAPDGSYVGGSTATIAPDGSYVGGSRSTICPDGSYVGGTSCQIQPDGSYTGR